MWHFFQEKLPGGDGVADTMENGAYPLKEADGDNPDQIDTILKKTVQSSHVSTKIKQSQCHKFN